MPTNYSQRNVIGAHAGAYALSRALAIASGSLDPVHRADLTNTNPTAKIGPFPQWADPERIVSLDPHGHMIAEDFADLIERGHEMHLGGTGIRETNLDPSAHKGGEEAFRPVRPSHFHPPGVRPPSV